jgi:putative IMPACT (imprinted ancient) family translation regulator
VVARALDDLPTVERVERVGVRIAVPFAASDALFRLLDELGATEREEAYGEGVVVRARVPGGSTEALAGKVAAMTAGAGRVEVEA